jgi:cytidyltransferase-like protein
MKIIICSGGFDPLHEGHIAYFKSAKQLGDKLIVALNSDEWLIRKKGKQFMNWHSRSAIIQELKCVDHVIAFDDHDDSARDAIQQIAQKYPNDEILFVNGGDRKLTNIPEMTEDYVKFVFASGGSSKQNSSSWILDDWNKWILSRVTDHTIRNWGWYEVLNQVSDNIKIKRLVVLPGKSLSYQRHYHRNEFWVVEEGTADVLIEGERELLSQGEYTTILAEQWHQLRNNTTTNLKVFEVQFGDRCIEEDIERI